MAGRKASQQAPEENPLLHRPQGSSNVCVRPSPASAAITVGDNSPAVGGGHQFVSGLVCFENHGLETLLWAVSACINAAFRGDFECWWRMTK